MQTQVSIKMAAVYLDDNNTIVFAPYQNFQSNHNVKSFNDLANATQMYGQTIQNPEMIVGDRRANLLNKIGISTIAGYWYSPSDIVNLTNGAHYYRGNGYHCSKYEFGMEHQDYSATIEFLYTCAWLGYGIYFY